MKEWLPLVALIVVGGGGLIYFSWMLSTLLDLFFSIQARRQFEADLFGAIESSKPALSQILVIASTRNIKTASVYRSLQKFLREALTGRNESLQRHLPLIEQYLAEMDEAEPFEGMPDEIRLHLDRLREKLHPEKGLLEPLANQIRELLAFNEKDRKRQKYYTIGGFFLGVIGVAFATFAYLNPAGEDSAPASEELPRSISAPRE